LNFLHEILDFLADLGRVWELFAPFCLEHPFLATLILFPVVIGLGYTAFNQSLYFASHVRVWARSKTPRRLMIVSVFVGVALSYSIVESINLSTRPAPLLSAPQVVVGRKLVLKWEYENTDELKNIRYEVQNSREREFGKKPVVKVPLTDSKLLFVNQNINASLYWRVRAIQSVDPSDESMDGRSRNISAWSNVVRTSQFESNLMRIKTTGRARVYASDSFNKGFFKFSKDGNHTGFDIELIRRVLDRLAERIGVPEISKDLAAVPFSELLSKLSSGDADIIISIVTRNEEREEKFGIQFSMPYYVTTQSILYRKGSEPDRFLESLRGRTLGVQDGTTTVDLLEMLIPYYEGERPFTIVKFKQTIEAVNKLLETPSQLDYVITDTPLAKSAKLLTSRGDEGVLGFKELMPDDFPPGTPRARTQEPYSIAVRAGETRLLEYIDDILMELKKEGALEKLEEEMIEEFGNFVAGS